MLIANAARRANHRSLGRRDRSDEEARRSSIVLNVQIYELGNSTAVELQSLEQSGVKDPLVFLPRAGIAFSSNRHGDSATRQF